MYSAGCVDGTLQFLGVTDGCQCPDAGGGGASNAGGTGGVAGASGSAGTSAAVPDLDACGAPMPCDPVVESVGLALVPPSDRALRCVIQGFHDRTPGVYVHDVTIYSETASQKHVTYLIKGDGSIASVTTRSSTEYSEVCLPRPPADFDDCLASTPSDAEATAECMGLEWTGDCTRAPVSCE